MDRIHSLEQEIAEIRKVLFEKEKELYSLRKQWIPLPQANRPQVDQIEVITNNSRINIDRLPKWAIERYSRQILLPDIGVVGQEKICSSRVLVVGAGGLGCPAAVYLAGAGVAEIGLVDYDTVELSNMHRQILHTETEQDMNKVDSAADYLRSINSKIAITPYKMQLDSTNAIEITSKYDIILDCSDNVPTRYLLNDAAVLTKKPLISGSALKMEGQLTIYGYRAENNSQENEEFIGPCYRCLFPSPPPPETVGSCSANGVLGPVPGVIGALQALETLKLIAGHTHEKLLVGRMLIFDGEDTTFRNVKLRPQNPQCAACSKNPTITQLIDYEVFCRAQAKEKVGQVIAKTDMGMEQDYHRVERYIRVLLSKADIIDLSLQLLPPNHRITATETNQLQLKDKDKNILIDVRNEQEFRMCRIDGAVNYPIEKLEKHIGELKRRVEECDGLAIFICRRGNDSQIAAESLLRLLDSAHSHKVYDMCGGLHAWAKEVDQEFPVY